MVYNFDSKEITGHSMVDLHGDILNMFFSHNDWVVFSNKKGQCIVLSLEFMKVKYKFVVKPLEHVISVNDIWNDSFHMAFVNAPNEIVYVKRHAKKTDYMIDSLDDPLLGRVQTKGCIRTVIGNSLVILVVNEDMEFTLLKKKTMTYIRSFNFFRMIPISLAVKFS